MKLPRKLKKAKKQFYLTKEFFRNERFVAKMRQFGATAFNDYTFRMMIERGKPYPATKWIRKYKSYLITLRNNANYELDIHLERPVILPKKMPSSFVEAFRKAWEESEEFYANKRITFKP